jgi:hypothetical protein
MFTNPHSAGQLASDRHREALAKAGQLRLARQLRAASRETRSAAALSHQVRIRFLATAARLRPASSNPAAVLTGGVRDA